MNADCCGEKFYTHYASQVLYFYIFSYKSADVWWETPTSELSCYCLVICQESHVAVFWLRCLGHLSVIGIYEFTSDLPAQWLTDEREGRRGTQVEVVLLSRLKHRSSFESRDTANIQNLREYPYFTLSFPTISPTPAQMFRIFHAVVCGMNKVWSAKHSSGSTYKGEFVHVGSG